MQNLRVLDVDWTVPNNCANHNQRIVSSDITKRRSLLEQFVFWYYTHFVTPLLRVSLAEHVADCSLTALTGQFLHN